MEQPYNSYLDLDFDDEPVTFKGWDRIFDETFFSYYELLIQRTKRMADFSKDSVDYRAYTDICLVMIRGLLIESERLTGNYTLQNYLKKHGYADIAIKVDTYLAQPINKLMSLREALKITVDKFIAHFDSIVGFDEQGDESLLTDIWFKRNLFLKDIQREDYPFSISRIVEFIQSIVDSLPTSTKTSGNSIALGL